MTRRGFALGMTSETNGRIFTARSLIPFGRGKRVRIPRGPRHCHRGRPGREATGRVRSHDGRAPGKEPDGGRSGSQETCRTERFLRRGKERGRAFESPGARDALSAAENVSSNGRFE